MMAALRVQGMDGSLTAVTASFGQQCLNIGKASNHDYILPPPLMGMAHIWR